MSDGKVFEKFVYDYYVFIRDQLGENMLVKLDQMVVGPDGERQCDVTVEVNINGRIVKTLVECKDYASRINIDKVDAFTSKLGDLGFQKGVIVARSGFQSGAIKKARRMGIELYSFANARKAVPNLPLSLPALYMIMKVTDLHVTFNATPDIQPPLLGLTQDVAEGVNVYAFLGAYLRPDRRLLKGVGQKNVEPLQPLLIQTTRQVTPGWIQIEDHRLGDINAYVHFSTSAYVGTIGDARSLHVKSDAISGNDELYLPVDKIPELATDLKFFADAREVPRYLFQDGYVFFSLDMTQDLNRKGLFETARVRATFHGIFGTLDPPTGKWLLRYSVNYRLQEMRVCGGREPASVQGSPIAQHVTQAGS